MESSPHFEVSGASAIKLMLHRTMASQLNLQLGLEDLLADLRHARKQDDLGRLALLAYCEVRRWARETGNAMLAKHASDLITGSPHLSREVFLDHIDELIHELEGITPPSADPGPRMSLSTLQPEDSRGRATG